MAPSGTPIGYINQRVDLHWVKRGDRWLIDDYTAYFDEQPIDAVGSAAGNRPVPERQCRSRSIGVVVALRGGARAAAGRR